VTLRSADWRAFVLIFVVAVVARGAILASRMVPREYLLAPHHVEVEAVARSLESTGRYADPYGVPTGPTAHPTPIHTGVIALMYRLLGTGVSSAYARAIGGIVLIAVMYAMLPWLASRLGIGTGAGLIGGLTAALLPMYGVGEVLGWLWTEALTAIVLGVLLTWFLRRWTSGGAVSAGSSLVLGLAAGIAFHLSPSLMPVVVACTAFELWWRRDRRRLADALIITTGALIACLPWAWRNWVAFHDVFFIRSNFGLELRVSNNDGAEADLWANPGSVLHPGTFPHEARQVQRLGEIGYMRQARDEAFLWVRSHPARFIRLTAERAWLIWFGPPGRPGEAIPIATLTILALLGTLRALRSVTVPQRAALLIPLATFPLVYYLVGYSARYVFPLCGLLLILAGFRISSWVGWNETEPVPHNGGGDGSIAKTKTGRCLDLQPTPISRSRLTKESSPRVPAAVQDPCGTCP
jgi:hypothetical protein